MPITIHELDNGWGNVIRYEGVVTSEEYDTALTEHLSKPQEVLKKYYYSISDATQVTKISIELKHIKNIASLSREVAKINPNVLVVIATHNETAFNVARMWAFISNLSSWNIQVFRSRQELDKWLVMKMKDQHDLTDLQYDHHLPKTSITKE